MEDSVPIIGYVFLSIIAVLHIVFIYMLIRLIVKKTFQLMKWFQLSPEQRKNRRRMNKTVKRLRKESKYKSSTDYGGGSSYYSYSSGGDGGDGGGGGCD